MKQSGTPEETEVEEQGELFEMEEEPSDVTDTDDGGAMVAFGEEQPTPSKADFFANIVEEVDEEMLEDHVEDLIEKFERDKDARKKRDELYEEGLRRTGLGDDAPGGATFSGATKVVHPLLVEACIDFSAKAMKEIFPSGGPAKSKIVGTNNSELTEKSVRKASFMNWQVTEQITEFRSEIEQLTTQLPLGGGQYLKLMWCPKYKRPAAEFIAVDNMLLPFAATNFYTAERKTHVQYITKLEYKSRIKSGMYIDVDDGKEFSTEMPERSDSGEANDKIEGREEDPYNADGLRKVFECFTWLDFGEGPEPYIITIDDNTQKCMALYRNWDPDNLDKEELYWIIEFPFVPWRGAYPIGLTHMIGSLSGAATGALRALLDSAHIQNVPTMLKLKGGPNGQTITLQPTEVVEIEGGVGVDDIRKIAMPIPFNPPSPTLFQLLGFLVDTGKGVVQTSFEKLSDQSPNQPVGTTMALIEQGMVVFSAIHARMHASMGMALKVLDRINSFYMTEEHLQKVPASLEMLIDDFDGAGDVVPVSDPNIFSDVQRFAQIQSILQRSAILPNMYDQRKVEEMFLRQMKISDEILVRKEDPEDLDPVSENVAAVKGSPIIALLHQEHLAHLQLHLQFALSPSFGKNPVMAKTFLPSMIPHVRDHMLLYYMGESHKAGKMAADQGLGEEDINGTIQLASEVQKATEGLFGDVPRALIAMEEDAKKLIPPPGQADGSVEVAKIGAEVQTLMIQQRSQEAATKNEVARMKIEMDATLDKLALQFKAQESQSKENLERMRQGFELEKERMKAEYEGIMKDRELRAKVLMNEADNKTAKELASFETLTGERTQMKNGNTIDPGN